MRQAIHLPLALVFVLLSGFPVRAVEDVYLTGVPDYEWWAGCFGTATGNLMGYWDRHGLASFYTGPTEGGVAPLRSVGINHGIVSLWASQAGLDGRPVDQPGHYDDYYVGYESTAPDPYLAAGRSEHTPDCIGDFIGLSQQKFPDLDGECSGNIDAYSFVYWDKSGDRRVNFTPMLPGGEATVDIQSGLRAWTRWRRGDCEVFTQLASFHPQVPAGRGFTFADMRAEITAGYPVLVFLQSYTQFFRQVGPLDRANPHIHGMLVYGCFVGDDGVEYVRCRTSWASGDNWLGRWDAVNWVPDGDLPVRGVIGYHPLPRIVSVVREGSRLKLAWEGPMSELFDAVEQNSRKTHGYIVEAASRLAPDQFQPVTGIITTLETTIDEPGSGSFFLRLRLVQPDPAGQ
jgi:hypothetical protein